MCMQAQAVAVGQDEEAGVLQRRVTPVSQAPAVPQVCSIFKCQCHACMLISLVHKIDRVAVEPLPLHT